MLKLILLDDEKNVREALTNLLHLFAPDVKVCAACADVNEAVSAINAHQPDILLLDVELGTGNGFDIFKHFPHPDFKVIFITAYQEYAVKAFRFSALDYLLKPVDPELLTETIKKAIEAVDHKNIALKLDSFIHNLSNIKKESKRIVLKTSDSIFVIGINEIIYCEAERSYTTFYLTDKKRIVVSTTLGVYEELFADHNFIRVHQSYLVNLEFVRRFDKSEGGCLILSNDARIPVSSRKKELVLQKLTSL